MATKVKIRGLERGDSSSSTAGASGTVTSRGNRGFRLKSGYGQQYPSGVKANATGGAGNNAMTVTAKYGGTWANSHVFTYAAGSADHAVTTSVALAASTGVPTLTYTAGTLATIAEIVTALNNDPFFSSYYTASTAGNGTGTSPVSAGTLANGTNSGTAQDIYVPVNNKTTVIADIDDAATARTLRRNYNRYVSLGAA